jgi:hypothetical protein
MIRTMPKNGTHPMLRQRVFHQLRQQGTIDAGRSVLCGYPKVAQMLMT